MTTDRYEWVDFYEELAHRLLEYKDNRKELASKVIQIFQDTGIEMPPLESDNKLIDIDPFTIFGLFNRNSMKEVNRFKILSAVSSLFDISANIPVGAETIPVIDNRNAVFYSFSNKRGANDINDLWNLFETALKYSNNKSNENRKEIIKHFDIVINKKGIGNSKITKGLHWIAPNFFMNLDERSIWYIYDSGKIPQDIVNSLPKVKEKIQASVYLDIAEKMHDYINAGTSEIKDFKELSSEALIYSEIINQEKKSKDRPKQRQDRGSALADEDVDTIHYWTYSPGKGAFLWEKFYNSGVMGIGWHEIGDLNQYEGKEDIRKALKVKYNPDGSNKNATLATWEFVNFMKPGDVIFVKKGRSQILGKGIVESEYYFDEKFDLEYPNLRKVKWIHKGEWNYSGSLAMKTLTDISPYTEIVKKLNQLFDDYLEEDEEEPEIIYPSYCKEDYLKDVYMSEEDYETLVDLVKIKKNVILQGAPGVGKTYAAKRLAYSMIGSKDQNRVKMVQFHQSYSYEDLIEGFRPTASGFEIKKGSLYEFCKKAADDSENDYFFIIDEINRGNLSKIFGELFMLIENDKRGNELELLYSDEKFFVPKNVYIIGMMNTADRSLAMLDYALRRRFAFYEMKPGFNSEGFRKYKMEFNSDAFETLIDVIESLNVDIKKDESLGEGFCIGHSYFCNLKEINSKVLSNIIEYELIPLLKEYWFDEPSKVREWSGNLRGVIK